jgi:hypothetical protein
LSAASSARACKSQPGIDAFHFHRHKSRVQARDRILRLLDLTFLPLGANVVLIGNPGVGKTFVARILAWKACQANQSLAGAETETTGPRILFQGMPVHRAGPSSPSRTAASLIVRSLRSTAAMASDRYASKSMPRREVIDQADRVGDVTQKKPRILKPKNGS